MTQPNETSLMHAMTHPTRPLIGPKPMRYVNAVRTDIRRTFRRFRLLDHLHRRSAGNTAAVAGLVIAAV